MKPKDKKTFTVREDNSTLKQSLNNLMNSKEVRSKIIDQLENMLVHVSY